MSLAADYQGMLRRWNAEGQRAREQYRRCNYIKYARLPLYGYNIEAGVPSEGGHTGVAAAAMVGVVCRWCRLCCANFFFGGGACTDPEWKTVHCA